MKKETRFTEEDLQAVYSALVSMNQELVVMREKVNRICAQAAQAQKPLDGIVYKLGRGKTRATQTTTQA